MSDEQYHTVARLSDLKADEVFEGRAGGLTVCLYLLGDQVFATAAICTHAYAELASGYINGDQIECPLHGGAFDIRTGTPTAPPCTAPLKTYPVRVEGDIVSVGLPAGKKS